MSLNFLTVSGGSLRLAGIRRDAFVGDIAQLWVAPLLGNVEYRSNPQQDVRLAWEGQVLHDLRTLSHYNIQHEATLNIILQTRPFQFYVMMDTTGDSLVLWGQPWLSIAAVKATIHDRQGIDPDWQGLTFKGRLLKDDKTLSDYNIHAASEIHCRVLPF